MPVYCWMCKKAVHSAEVAERRTWHSGNSIPFHYFCCCCCMLGIPTVTPARLLGIVHAHPAPPKTKWQNGDKVRTPANKAPSTDDTAWKWQPSGTGLYYELDSMGHLLCPALQWVLHQEVVEVLQINLVNRHHAVAAGHSIIIDTGQYPPVPTLSGP